MVKKEQKKEGSQEKEAYIDKRKDKDSIRYDLSVSNISIPNIKNLKIKSKKKKIKDFLSDFLLIRISKNKFVHIKKLPLVHAKNKPIRQLFVPIFVESNYHQYESRV